MNFRMISLLVPIVGLAYSGAAFAMNENKEENKNSRSQKRDSILKQIKEREEKRAKNIEDSLPPEVQKPAILARHQKFQDELKETCSRGLEEGLSVEALKDLIQDLGKRRQEDEEQIINKARKEFEEQKLQENRKNCEKAQEVYQQLIQMIKNTGKSSDPDIGQ